MKASVVEQEEMRLAVLRGYNILDTDPDEGFDDLAQLAADLCDMPIALVSLVDQERQWFKAVIGTGYAETPIEMSICAHAIQQGDFLEVEDCTKDARTAQNPLVTGPDNIRFYAGALLRSKDGFDIGTLCVMDTKPRQLNDFQRKTLKRLAGQVMRLIELREALGAAEMLRREVDHRVKNSLQSLEALIRIQTRGAKDESARNALEAVQGRLSMVSSLHEALYLSDAGAVVDLSNFLGRVVQTATGQMPQGVSVERDIDALRVDSRAASSVGMIVNEAMANAAKYAYGDGQSGTFRVTGRRLEDAYVLTCADDGGTPEETSAVAACAAAEDATPTPTPISGTGLGNRIMLAAAQQMGGELETTPTPQGYVVTLRWPLT